jgi:hypothetical protein
MAWVLTRGLTVVRGEFNEVFPGRDKASDGSKGDRPHELTISGHNPDLTGRSEHRDGDSLDEVRAIDVDRDLVRGSGTDWMELVVQYLIRRARAGYYIPFEYIIYKRRIWSRSDGWRTRVYTGANDHDKHAHFSGAWSQVGDNWTGSLGLATVRGASATGGQMFCKYGDRGEAVRLLQYQLHNLGFNLGAAGADGKYGDTTAKALTAAIKSFNGSTVDGKTYGAAQAIFISVLWVRRWAPEGALTGTFTIEGGTLRVTTQEEGTG